MDERPKAGRLLDTVSTFLKERILPEAEGRDAYETRVAINVLGIVARELDLGDGHRGAEHARLRTLLGRGGELDELNRALCTAIRDGDIALGDAELLAHLRRTTLDSLAVNQPRYATYRRALERAGDGSGS